jgi:N-carbamoylputrescine amidase
MRTSQYLLSTLKETPNGIDQQRFWGSSFVAGPQGELLAQATTDQEETLVVTLDRGRSEAVRRMWPFLRDRRIDAYADLTKRYRD